MTDRHDHGTAWGADDGKAHGAARGTGDEVTPLLRPLTEADIPAALALSREAGWPHGAGDWADLLDLSEGLAFELAGRLVGTACLIRYGAGEARFAMIIIARAMRGRGLGRRLVAALLERAGDRTCRLVATADGAPLYLRAGFAVDGAVLSHQGHAAPGGPETGLRPAGPEDLPRIRALDLAATGIERGPMLDLLARRGALFLPQDGAEGYLALRAAGAGHTAGPVVAADAALARGMLTRAFAMAGETRMRVDVPGDSVLGPWLRARGLAPGTLCETMTRPGPAEAPRAEPGRIGSAALFALASQALG